MTMTAPSATSSGPVTLGRSKPVSKASGGPTCGRATRSRSGRAAPGDRIAVQLIHHPPVADDAVVAEYPSHLHIDLLPAAQGQRHGRRLVERLAVSLHDAGSPGVHLGVSARNDRAISFYRHLGFDDLIADEHHHVFAMRLD